MKIYENLRVAPQGSQFKHTFWVGQKQKEGGDMTYQHSLMQSIGSGKSPFRKKHILFCAGNVWATNHQKPSKTIRNHQKTIKNHQKPPETIKNPSETHQKPSENIRNHQKLSNHRLVSRYFPIQKWQFRILLFFGSRPGADGTTGMSGLRLGQRLWWQWPLLL